MEQLDGIWVFAEQDNGNLPRVTKEVISEGRRLADRLKCQLTAALMGYHTGKLVEDLGKFGADKVILIDSPSLENYDVIPYCSVMAPLVQQHQPVSVLFGATLTGNDLASRLAARIKGGLVTNCNLLEIAEDGAMLAIRHAYGGKVSVTFQYASNRAQLATLSPGAVEISLAVRQPQVITIDNIEISPAIVERIEVLKGAPENIGLSEAEVIVAGGRGMGNQDRFNQLGELARLLGASVGGTRIAVDNGWLPFERQVGQTGKMVSPRFFMTLGTSGAIQYTNGFKDAEFILAIDKNSRAVIFEIADVGVVGDIQQILPAVFTILKKGYEPNS